MFIAGGQGLRDRKCQCKGIRTEWRVEFKLKKENKEEKTMNRNIWKWGLKVRSEEQKKLKTISSFAFYLELKVWVCSRRIWNLAGPTLHWHHLELSDDVNASESLPSLPSIPFHINTNIIYYYITKDTTSALVAGSLNWRSQQEEMDFKRKLSEAANSQ